MSKARTEVAQLENMVEQERRNLSDMQRERSFTH